MKNKGYVALTVVIILIPILVMGGVDLLYKNIDILNIAKQLSDSEKLNFALRSCTEESIRKVKQNLSLTGEQSFVVETTNCTVTILNDTTPGVKILSVRANTGALYRTETKKLDTTKSPFEISN